MTSCHHLPPQIDDCMCLVSIHIHHFVIKQCVLTFLYWLETDCVIDGGALLVYLKLCVMFTSVSYRKFCQIFYASL